LYDNSPPAVNIYPTRQKKQKQNKTWCFELHFKPWINNKSYPPPMVRNEEQSRPIPPDTWRKSAAGWQAVRPDKTKRRRGKRKKMQKMWVRHGNKSRGKKRQLFTSHATQKIPPGKEKITGTVGARAGKMPSSAKHVTQKNQKDMKNEKKLPPPCSALSFVWPPRPPPPPRCPLPFLMLSDHARRASKIDPKGELCFQKSLEAMCHE